MYRPSKLSYKYFFLSAGVLAAVAGPDSAADVAEQHDQHAQHALPGPGDRLAGVCAHGAGCEERGCGPVRVSGGDQEYISLQSTKRDSTPPPTPPQF